MDIENTSETSNTSVSTEPTADTATAPDSATADTQASSATPAGSSDATPDVTNVTTQIAPDARANTQSVETSTPTTPEIDYKARFIGAQKSWQAARDEGNLLKQQAAEFQNQLNQLKQQYQGVNPQDIEKFRATQKVPVWDETSPGHQQFQELRRTYDVYTRMLQRAPDEPSKLAMQEQMQEELGADGIKTLREWQADVRRQEWERQTNPQAFYRKLIQKEAQPVFQQGLQNVSQTYQSVQAAQGEVQKWMKESAEVATPENIKSILSHMEKGVTFDVAAARVERDYYRSKVSTGMNAQKSAEEKERLLQGNAAGTIARNPNTAKKVDFKAVAKERGLKSERERLDLLFELEQQGKL